MARKARVKRKVSHELKRAQNPVEAQEVLTELQAEVAKKVEVSQKERAPGMTVGGTKVGFTYNDLCNMFPIVSFTPRETVLLTFQGVPVQAISGVEMHVPKCFEDMYRRRERAQDKPDLRELKARGIDVALGAGADISS